MPVQKADIIVPSLVPTIEKLKNIIDKTIAKITQLTSNAILTLPKFLFVVSEIAFTKASPEFIMTLAITESDTPKLNITIPRMSITNFIGYVFTGINDTSHIPKLVKYPNNIESGI